MSWLALKASDNSLARVLTDNKLSRNQKGSAFQTLMEAAFNQEEVVPDSNANNAWDIQHEGKNVLAVKVFNPWG